MTTGCAAPIRLKREEARIAKEIEEREQEEARKMLASVQTKIGSKRLNIADGAPLDKATLMNQVHPLHSAGCGTRKIYPFVLAFCFGAAAKGSID